MFALGKTCLFNLHLIRFDYKRSLVNPCENLDPNRWQFQNPCVVFNPVKVCLKLAAYHMERDCESYENKSHAKLRLHNVAGHMTEVLELHAERPSFHILFIPGNPGVISFYRDYLEVLYELLDKKASVTAVGHVAHTSKDWEDGKLFSLQEQISHKVRVFTMDLGNHGYAAIEGSKTILALLLTNYSHNAADLEPTISFISCYGGVDSSWVLRGGSMKGLIWLVRTSYIAKEAAMSSSNGRAHNNQVEFIKEELLQHETPIVLAGHSIGAYISLDIFKAFPHKVSYMIGMYPFLTLNRESKRQSFLTKLAKLPILCAGLSSLAGLVGLAPTWFQRGLIKSLMGCTWSSDAVHVASTYLLRYSMVRNYTYMGMTEFEKLQEIPDWTFIRGKQNQISFLFGSDDHWGPLSLFEEVSQKAPGINLAIEKEGHTHAFCCTKAGSTWVANHTVDLIKQHLKGVN